MVIYKEQLVQRGLNYAIIDEVDSILIDEARTPLIISGQSGKATKLYEVCDVLAKQMKRGADEEMIYKLDAVMDTMMGTDSKPEETGDFVLNEKDAQGVQRSRSSSISRTLRILITVRYSMVLSSHFVQIT